MLLASLFTVLFIVRSMAPRGMMKIGISMLQIVATANSVYTIPWPPAFSSFLDLMKIFLVCHRRSSAWWAEEGMGMQIYVFAWDACTLTTSTVGRLPLALFVMDCHQVDIITITRTNCATRTTYFEQMLITLLIFKVLVLLALVLAWLEPKIKARIREYRKV